MILSWRPLALAGLGGLLGLFLGLTATMAQASCRQALALGLDVSGSVDAREYRLQLDGVASALMDPEVQQAFLAFPGAPVRLMVFEWSAREHQRQIIGWTDIRDAGDLQRAAAILRATRSVPVANPSTAISAAIVYGARELQQQGDCWQMTLDISGDGPANIGRHPGEIGPEHVGTVTVNGLVIGPDTPSNTTKNRANVTSLLVYYERHVLRGPASFAETAQTFEDFAQAMRRKLIRELAPTAISEAGR